jgi:hypothetical protein
MTTAAERNVGMAAELPATDLPARRIVNSAAERIRVPLVTLGRRCLIGVGLSVSLSGCTHSTAPLTGVSGTWNGTLSQPNGPVYKNFTYSMNLQQSGSSVTGSARISLVGQPQYYGQFSVSGTVNGAAFSFSELQITAQVSPPSGSYWCLKQGTLTLSGDGKTLSGSWSSTSGCAPGTIALTRG